MADFKKQQVEHGAKVVCGQLVGVESYVVFDYDKTAGAKPSKLKSDENPVSRREGGVERIFETGNDSTLCLQVVEAGSDFSKTFHVDKIVSMTVHKQESTYDASESF
jgi:hypothetical protein